MDHLDKTWSGVNAAGAPTATDSQEERWLPKEPHWLQDAHVNNNHWASLAPEMRSATAVPDRNFPKHEWSDMMPPGRVDTNNFSAEQLQYMAHASGVSAAGPHPMACANPPRFMVGHTSAMPPAGPPADGASAYMGALASGHNHDGWDAPAAAAANNASFAYHGAGAMWPHSSGQTAAGSERMIASTSQQNFGEKAVHGAPVSAEQYHCRTSSSPTSEAGGVESVTEGSAERTAGNFHWWADPASSDYMGDMYNG